MNGIWLVTYLILWIFTLLQTVLLIYLLRHIGNLRVWLKNSGVIREELENIEDGPIIGERIKHLEEILSDYLLPSNDQRQRPVLLLFVPAGFFGCDDLLTALQRFYPLHNDILQIIIVSFEPADDRQFDVVREYGINAPIITKYGIKVSLLCHVHTAPYAVIVNSEYKSLAKLPVDDFEGLDRLFNLYKSRSDEIWREK